jgi:hypothetical protein
MLEALHLVPAEPKWPDLTFRENVWLRYSFHAQFYDHNETVALHVYAEPWYLLRRTPKGAWVSRYGPSHFLADHAKRFILDFNEAAFSGTPPRRFAYRCPEHAKRSLLRRHSFHKHYHDLASKRIAAIDAWLSKQEAAT